MSEPFLGQITVFAFGLVPQGYAPCDGRLLSINQNQALYSLLGTQFGGDGRTNFGLPDLRGRVVTGRSPSHSRGSAGGAERIALTGDGVPQHTHSVFAAIDPGTAYVPTASSLMSTVTAPTPPASMNVYRQTDWSNDTGLADATLATAGGGQPHENMQPFAVVNYCIAIGPGANYPS